MRSNLDLYHWYKGVTLTPTKPIFKTMDVEPLTWLEENNNKIKNNEKPTISHLNFRDLKLHSYKI